MQSDRGEIISKYEIVVSFTVQHGAHFKERDFSPALPKERPWQCLALPSSCLEAAGEISSLSFPTLSLELCHSLTFVLFLTWAGAVNRTDQVTQS